MIERKHYLAQLIHKKENGLIKVITGIRRCGKSYLLNIIYYQYLLENGVGDDQIIKLALDNDENIQYRNPLELGKFIRSKVTDSRKQYYVFLDEIQKVVRVKNPYLPDGADEIGFVDTLLGLMALPNVDIYVTGSNSKMLSSDILTEFRGREDEIRMAPLMFSEFYAAFKGDKRDAWREYFTYGGMPMILSFETHEDKSRYLKQLFERIYLEDILERNAIRNERSVLDEILNVISSAVGSLTNPDNIANTFRSLRKIPLASETVASYLDCFEDAFLIERARRYDIRGRKYIGSPLKYYFADSGLRNARLAFRELEENRVMENIVYNELRFRGFDVDVGTLEYNFKDSDGRSRRKRLEVDFVANKGNVRFYIQVALSVADSEKLAQETNPLVRTKDSFKKIIVVKDRIVPHFDSFGIWHVGIEDFLLASQW